MSLLRHIQQILHESNARFVSPHPAGTSVPIKNRKWSKVTHAYLMRKNPNGDDWRARDARGNEVFTITWPDVQDYMIKEAVELHPGALPDRGTMPSPFPVIDQHVPNDPRFTDAPLRRVPLHLVHATQRTIDTENVKKFIDDPTLGGKPVVALHDKGYAIVDGHHRLAAARMRGETYALAHVVEDAPANASGVGGVAGLGVGPQGEPGVRLPRKRRMDEETKLWKYNKRSGYWDLQRSVTDPHDEQKWFGVYQKDEPSEHFKLSKNRPSGKPKLQEDTFAGGDVLDTDMGVIMGVKEPKRRWERYAKYVGVEEEGETIRQHARKSARDIILRDSKTGTMTYLRKRGWHK